MPKFNLSYFCAKTVEYLLYAAVFLTPILFLPWTNYQLTWSKQFALIVLALTAFVAWLVKGIIKGELVYAKSFLNILSGGLVLAALASGWFSAAPYVGLLGLTGAEMNSSLNILGFVLLFFLLAAAGLDRKRLVITFLASSLLVWLIGLLQISGIWLFPFEFTQSATFNTIGTTNAWSLFLGLVFVMVFFTVYEKRSARGRYSVKKLNLKNILTWTFLAVLLVTIFLLKFWLPFAGILLAAALFLIVEWRGQGKLVRERIIIPLILGAVSVLIIYNYFFPNGLYFLPALRIDRIPIFQLPLEVTPSPGASWLIAKSTGQEGLKNFLIGAGGGAFQYQYGLYRSVSLNDSDFWNVRFVQSFNAYLTHLVEWGILGLAAWLLFLMFLFWEALKTIIRSRRGNGVAGDLLPSQPVIGIGLIYLIATFFLYPQNFVLYFMIFVLGALLIEQEKEQRVVAIANSPVRTFGFSLVLMMTIILTLSLVYLEVRRYLGSVYFYEATRALGVEGNLEKIIAKINRATVFDPWNDFYFQSGAQARLGRINQIINQQTANQEELQKSQQEFADILGQAIQFGKKATELNSLESQNWFTLGQIYEAVIMLVPGAAESAISAYEGALKLEPNNPLMATAIGRTHLVFGDFLKQKNDVSGAKSEYDLGVTELERAVSLKANYLPAQLLLIKGYDHQGKDLRAVQKSNEIALLANNDASIFYQLAFEHFQLGRLHEARQYFEKAVELFPDYSDARYYLGIVYERNDQRTKAIEQFKKILQLNPGRDDIKTVIDNLKNNRSSGAAGGNSILKEEPKSPRP